jgi:hypothetical protein
MSYNRASEGDRHWMDVGSFLFLPESSGFLVS